MELSIYSLIPPVLALAMVIITRKVLLSLGLGIVVGALMLNGFDPLAACVMIYEIFVRIIFDFESPETLSLSSIHTAMAQSGFALNTWEFFLSFCFYCCSV